MNNCNAKGRAFGRLFFVPYEILKAKSRSFDERSKAFKTQSKWAQIAKKLTCKYCKKTFHKPFGVSRHIKSNHPDLVKDELKSISSTSHYRYKRDVRDDTDEDIVDDDEYSEYSDETDDDGAAETDSSEDDPEVTIFGPNNWKLLETLDEFNPKVVVRDIYQFNETSYPLPEKPSTTTPPKSPMTTPPRTSTTPPTTDDQQVELPGHPGHEDDFDHLPATTPNYQPRLVLKDVLKSIPRRNLSFSVKDGDEISINVEASSSASGYKKTTTVKTEPNGCDEMHQKPKKIPLVDLALDSEEDEEEAEPLAPNPRLNTPSDKSPEMKMEPSACKRPREMKGEEKPKKMKMINASFDETI